MPTVPHTLAQVSSSFLPGTQVSAWIDPLRDLREQPPPGGPVATGTVATSGSLTFTGLQPQTRYVAYANGRVVQFTTGSVETSLEQLTDRVAALEAARPVFARVNSDGTLNAGTAGVGSTRQSTGLYSVTYAPAFTARNVQVTPITLTVMPALVTISSGTIVVRFRDRLDALTDVAFFMEVAGGF